MITTYINSNYRITYEGVSMVENALGNPNLVQISVTSGCTIVVPGSDENKKFGIDYLPNGEARSWKLNGLNTRINKKEAHFIFARLGRNEESALLVFSTNDYRIDGSVVSGGTETIPASDSFFYIKVGIITATDAVGESATLDREITYDGGYYRTDNYNDTGGIIEKMFAITSDGLINALKAFSSFTVRGTLGVIGKIVLNEKQIAGVAREMDDSAVIDDETIPTTAFLNGTFKNELEKQFLSRLEPDSAEGLIKFLSGIESGAYKKGVSGARIDKDGIAELLNAVIRGNVRSDNYRADLSGYGLLKDDGSGFSLFEVDKLVVRLKAVFAVLEVKKRTHVGGEEILSPAGMKCTKVEEVYYHNEGILIGYRCYFNAEADGVKVKNDFIVGTLAISQEYNVESGSGNRFYWRRVDDVGEDWILLSAVEGSFVPNSDIPAVGDDIVALGHISDISRQNAIILSSVGTSSPSITFYMGIDDFSLEGKDVFFIGWNPDKQCIEFRIQKGDGNNGYFRYTTVDGLDMQGNLKLSTGKRVEDVVSDSVKESKAYTDDSVSDFDGKIEDGVNEARSYTNTQITAIDGKLTSSISGVMEYVGGQVSELNTKIEQNADSISAKASQEEVTALGNRLSEAELNLQPDNIWLGIRKKTANLKNLFKDGSFEYGGNTFTATNMGSIQTGTGKNPDVMLLKEGDEGYPLPYGSRALAARMWGSGDSFLYIDQKVPVEAGKKYSVIFWHMDGGTPGDSSCYVRWSNGGHSAKMPVVWKYVWHREVWCVTAPEDATYMQIRFGRTGTSSAWSLFDGVMVIEGDYTQMMPNGTISASDDCPDDFWPNESDSDAALASTGINISNRKITLTADNVDVKDSNGDTLAMFNRTADGKAVLATELINANELSVKKEVLIGADEQYIHIWKDNANATRLDFYNLGEMVGSFTFSKTLKKLFFQSVDYSQADGSHTLLIDGSRMSLQSLSTTTLELDGKTVKVDANGKLYV